MFSIVNRKTWKVVNLEFNENQKKAIAFFEGCCNVIASAGSGKTGVLVHRIHNLIMNHDVDPNKILAITFSKKAKENMMERLEKILPEHYKYLHIETFHSFGYSIIRKFNRIGYQILDVDWKKNKIIEDVYKNLFHVSKVDGSIIAECITYISLQKNHLKFPKKNSNEDCEQVYYFYEKYKQDNYCLDFDDMLTMAYKILSENEKALEYCQQQYKFILADEMQDTNTAQYEILRLIAKKHQNVFFVDDPLQNIFEWRGSDNKYVLGFDSAWDKNTTTINLNCNYRSSQNIVALANKFATTIPESGHKYYIESVADKPSYKIPEFQLYLNEKDEAEKIADKIQQMVLFGDYSYKDFAILARTNAQLANFESAMHRFAVPYLIVDGVSFVDRKEIKIVLSYLKLACNLLDNKAFSYIYNKPNRYLSKQFLDEVKKAATKEKTSYFYAMHSVSERNFKYANGVREIADVVDSLNRMRFSTVKDRIEYIRQRLRLDEYVSGEVSDDNNSFDKIDNLNTLSDIANDYTSVEEFISYMDKLIMEDNSNGDTVKLMTIHKSKGLEYPIVFIVGVNEDLLPHHRNENVNEERRLMYVAITRAEKELYISSTLQYGRKPTNPSIFINELFKQ